MVEQHACRAGEYDFRDVLDEEVLELHDQMLVAGLLVKFNGFYDGLGEEVCRLLFTGCCGLADHGVQRAGECDVEQDLARWVGVVGRQNVDWQEPIEFVAEGPQCAPW
ncbi:hypothetical protein [Streptomyces sp. NRRL S-646]|uniref:hypothetical protein n=1 Tax=Streptomyces sp. NRRL S-646 TaxID=1463917 RepID=UPI0004C9D099|nr:hypothetical protein [Streptomyces sp. NRRL S-646]